MKKPNPHLVTRHFTANRLKAEAHGTGESLFSGILALNRTRDSFIALGKYAPALEAALYDDVYPRKVIHEEI